MTRLKIGLLLLLVASCFALGGKIWEDKPYTDWSEKDATKILNDSPWGETYTLTDTTQMVFTPGKAGDQNVNREVYRHFRVRWVSAQPIRMAISRLTGLRSKGEDPSLQQFVDTQFQNHIFIAIDFETNEPRYKGEMFSLFAAMTIGDLVNSMYLVRASDGKKNFVAEYRPPGDQGLGAQFLFPRNIDGQPFLTEKESRVRLIADLRGQHHLVVPFKPQEMVFKGKLEY